MFDLSFEGYLNWIEKLREDVRNDPDEWNIRMLARVLYDCIVVCDTREAEKHGLLLEAVYWWLHLYYNYGKEEYLARAESVLEWRAKVHKPGLS